MVASVCRVVRCENAALPVVLTSALRLRVFAELSTVWPAVTLNVAVNVLNPVASAADALAALNLWTKSSAESLVREPIASEIVELEVSSTIATTTLSKAAVPGRY